jgi:hypothetical protein
MHFEESTIGAEYPFWTSAPTGQARTAGQA